MLPQLLVAHSLHVVGLYAGKEWVLILDVGVPWLLIRVLALGGLGFVVWEVKYGRLFASRAIEVQSPCFPIYSRAHFHSNFGNAVVRCRDGLALCTFAARVVARCFSHSITRKVWLHSIFRHCGMIVIMSWVLRCRVIIFTQYSTVWPKVLTGRSSVRSPLPCAQPNANKYGFRRGIRSSS